MSVKDNETIEDVVRKIRNEIAELRKVSPNVPSVAADWWEARADETEAAHKRDIDRELDKLWKRIGNKTKLREAVERCLAVLKRIDWLGDGVFPNGKFVSPELLARAIQEAEAALAEPARNCDKYATADEALKAQEQMFNDSNFANGECKLGCPECDNPRVGCKIAWLFAPATEKEGGAK